MKMTFATRLNLAACLTAGLLALAPARVQAQPTSVNLTLEALYQNPSVPQSSAYNGDITTTAVSVMRITPATVQALIASNLSLSLSNYTLAWDQTAGTLGETNAKTGDFQSVSSILSIGTDASGSGDFVTSGTSDTIDAIAQGMSTYAAWTVTFNDNVGNSFNLTGLIKSSSVMMAPPKGSTNTTQTETVSFSGNVTGYGTIVDKAGNTDNAVFTGTISGYGRGPAGS